MTDLLLDYGSFLAKLITLVIAITFIIAMIASLAKREREPARLEIKNLNGHYQQLERQLLRHVLPRKEYKKRVKQLARAVREQERETAKRKKLFLLDFHGDVRATAVASLREEITAVLRVAGPEDEVLVRLENAGGLVHDHGLAASQLLRLRQQGIPLTIAVDKIATSGGYMMACVADRIMAAPFAILGSIGVLLQLPNFHRVLDRKGVDFELLKGGRHKRTLTLFAENTDEDRQKAKQEIEDLHALFKQFVSDHRPRVQIDQVATGEYWYGTRARSLELCDELVTSDDYLLRASKDTDLLAVSMVRRKPIGRRLAGAFDSFCDGMLSRWLERRRADAWAA